MTDLEKAARMALEALEQLQGGCTDSNDGTMEAITVWCPEVITALRQALEQPAQQEPVDWEAVAADYAMTIAMMKAEQVPFCYHDGRNIVGHEFADFAVANHQTRNAFRHAIGSKYFFRDALTRNGSKWCCRRSKVGSVYCCTFNPTKIRNIPSIIRRSITYI